MGGMKPGTGDDPYAETTEGSDDSESTAAAERQTAVETKTRGQQQSRPSLPYKFTRDSVKNGRNQRPIFLRSEVEEELPELILELETRLGEDVYKTDVQEAAILLAIENPDMVAEKLREWGYDWE